MALPATVHHFALTISDVDRGVYEATELHVARHPSETVRHMVTRVLAYALSYESGIAFSHGGVSSSDEPALSIVDPTGMRTAWIEIGSPSADRLHRASKATARVAVYTTQDLFLLRREATSRDIHRVHAIEVWVIEAALVAALEEALGRRATLEVARNAGRLYVTVDGRLFEGGVELTRLTA